MLQHISLHVSSRLLSDTLDILVSIETENTSHSKSFVIRNWSHLVFEQTEYKHTERTSILQNHKVFSASCGCRMSLRHMPSKYKVLPAGIVCRQKLFDILLETFKGLSSSWVLLELGINQLPNGQLSFLFAFTIIIGNRIESVMHLLNSSKVLTLNFIWTGRAMKTVEHGLVE